MSNFAKKGFRKSTTKTQRTKLKTVQHLKSLKESKQKFLDMHLEDLTKTAKDFYNSFPGKHVEDVQYSISTGEMVLTEEDITRAGTTIDILTPKPYEVPQPEDYEGRPRYAFAYIVFNRILVFTDEKYAIANADLGEQKNHNQVHRSVNHLVLPLEKSGAECLLAAEVKLLDDFVGTLIRSGFMAVEHERERLVAAQAKLQTKDIASKLAEVSDIFEHAKDIKPKQKTNA